MYNPKTCQIMVWNEQDFELDQEMTNKAMLLCAHHLQHAKLIDVYPQQRVPADAPSWQNPGWLEWLVMIQPHSGAKLTIGIIQRKPGAEFECHS